MKKHLLVFIISSFPIIATAQNTKPCSSPEASQFDFWIGAWNLYSADTLTGTNTIIKVMDGCTVQENFESPQIKYYGKSWSVYNSIAKIWQQTWIDNQGRYIALTGKWENGVMTLTTDARKLADGKEQVSRMIYHSIKKDHFEWEWESTTDNGKTWKNNWHIRYERKKLPD